MRKILSLFLFLGLIFFAISATATLKESNERILAKPSISTECNCPPSAPLVPMSEAPASPETVPLVSQEEEVIVIETPGEANPFLVAPLSKLLDKAFPAPDGEMSILFSTQERMTLKAGKIADYFCVEGLSSPCRVKMDFTDMIKDLSGIVKGANDKPVMVYTNKIYSLKDEAKSNPPDAVFKLDGVPVKVEYKERQFTISKAK